MANWEGFQIQIPAQGLLRELSQILETLLVFLEIVKSILEVVKIFLILFGNPLILLLEALMALILDLFHMLQQTGIYGYFDLPNLEHDPNFKAIAGGSQAFKNRFKGSLLDLKDAHRPQPDSLLQGGFVLLVIDADGPLILIQIIKAIVAFFKNPGKIFEPQYPAAVNLKAVPLDRAGSAILDIETLLGNQSQSLAFEWQLPGLVPSASAGFTGLTATVIQNFRIPNWLIEVGESPPTQPIVISPAASTGSWNNNVMRDARSTGRLVQNTVTPFNDCRTLQPIATQVPVLDDHGDPIIKFSYYAIIDGYESFFADLGGTVRWVWNLPLDKTYYVRVRAFFGTFSTQPASSAPGNFVLLNWPNKLSLGDNNKVAPFLKWPSASIGTDMAVGKPSTMIKARLSKIPDFDVMGDLRALFQTAFGLNFHIPLPPAVPETTTVIDASGNPQQVQTKDSHGNPIYKPQFDSGGNPLPPLSVADIGTGTLKDRAGAVSAVYPSLLGGQEPYGVVDEKFLTINLTGSPSYVWPWQDTLVQSQSNKLAIKFGNILLEHGATQIAAFKQIMRGPLSAGAVPGFSSLENMVTTATEVTALAPILAPGASASVAAAFAAAGLNTIVSRKAAQAYVDIFSSASARRNVAAGINYLRSLGFQGVPPDWISMSIMDLIPWSGQILYKLVAMVQALIDAFKGLMQQLIDFVNLIERKITALEVFIEYLINILNFLLSLNVGFYLLFEPMITGDVTAWFNAVDSTAGTPPTSGPNGYTAGICLAYLLPDVSAIADAFGLIF